MKSYSCSKPRSNQAVLVDLGLWRSACTLYTANPLPVALTRPAAWMIFATKVPVVSAPSELPAQPSA